MYRTVGVNCVDLFSIKAQWQHKTLLKIQQKITAQRLQKKNNYCRHVLIEGAEVLLLADLGGESDDCLIISR